MFIRVEHSFDVYVYVNLCACDSEDRKVLHHFNCDTYTCCVDEANMNKKRKSDYECPYKKHGCKKKFKDGGMNDENLKRHTLSCTFGKKEKKGILSYWTVAASTSISTNDAENTAAVPSFSGNLNVQVEGTTSSSSLALCAQGDDDNELEVTASLPPPSVHQDDAEAETTK